MNNRFQRTVLSRNRRAATRSRGFTLIEMMVALSILMLMLAIIFVPLNLGINFFHMGRARAEVQQAAQLTLNQVETDLRQAMFVFPNAAMPGITDQAPYTNGDATGAGHPYYQSDNSDQTYAAGGTAPNYTYTANSIACGSHSRVDNTGRIDFILPKTVNGTTVTPLQKGPYLIVYYVRRLNPYDASTSPIGFSTYDSIDNPLVLCRAQIPLLKGASTPQSTNVDTSDTRYPSGACGSGQNDQLAWLAQSKYGEPNLYPLTQVTTLTGSGQVGLHDLVTPRGMGLVAPHAADDQNASLALSPTPSPNFAPETSFICEDSNGDGKIDRVKITVAMGQYDSAGAQPTAQTVRLQDTIDLPNVQ